MADKSIYLASRSPRRRELLKQIGVNFEVLMFRGDPRRGPDVDETPFPNESAGAYALRVAREKAVFGAEHLLKRGLPPRPVLAADTTVVIDDAIIGKPDDAAHAAQILRALSGREHRVITVIAMADRDDMDTRISVSQVWFREISDAEIQRYIQSGEPFDKAGAYGIQGRAAAFITRIDGSYSGIMGLPLAETVELMQQFGLQPV